MTRKVLRNAFALTVLLMTAMDACPMPAACATIKVQNAGFAVDKASRRGGIGSNIRDSELIVIGVVGANNLINVKEVLKGDKAMKGQSIELPVMRTSCGPFPQPGPNEKAILFGKSWRTSTDPLIEIYETAEHIEALRQLLRIYADPSETKRLTAIKELWQTKESALYRDEFLAAINEMKEPANFSIVFDAYRAAAPEDQVKLLDWMALTGDERAVPILFQALNSKDRFVKSSAESELVFHFPGVKGVDALKKNMRKGPLTTYQKAEELRTKGKLAEAIPLYLSLIEAPESDAYSRRFAAVTIISHASAPQKERMRKALMPLLTQDAKTGNYLEAADAAEILRGLHHMQCLPPLIDVLEKQDYIFEKSVRTATMAIRDLGPATKRQGARHLLKQMHTVDQYNTQVQERMLLSLVWLVDDADFTALQALIKAKPGLQSPFQKIDPMFALRRQPDEGKFLIDMMAKPISHSATLWSAYRLGDLKDKRAGALLVQELKRNIGDGQYSIENALNAIGGPEVEKSLQQIASDSKHPAQTNALNVLGEVQGARSLPLMRRIAQSGSIGAKAHALNWLSRIGTADDLKHLVPSSNYWTGDRTNHYWIMQAITGIRERVGNSH